MASESAPAKPANAVTPRLTWAALVWRSLVYFVLLYLIMLGLLMLLEGTLIFRPTRAEEEWFDRVGFAKQDVWLDLETGERIHAWWCPLANASWFVLYCHGNAGNLSFRDGLIELWQKRVGASVLIFDYPGYGHSTGRPNEKNCNASGLAAYRWLREQGAAPERIVLFGESLGGGVAVELAVSQPHTALVLEAAFTSIPELAQEIFPFVPARWLCRTRFNNLSKLRHYTGSLLLIHGEDDTLVPPHHSQRLFEACPSKHKKLLLVPGHDHNSVGFAPIYGGIRAFLESIPTPTSPEP